jgi:SAM-dependent methyltransferase
MSGGYDEGYKACPCFWGREPGSLVKWFASVCPSVDGFRVLDAGCGEGKNAVYFARAGAQVRAIDISEAAIANARHAWPAVDNIRWEVADIATAELADRWYDIVVAYGLLHCLPDEGVIRGVVERLQRATKVGGFNIVCAFNDRSQDLRAHPNFRPCLADHQFYIDLYSDWRILSCSDSDLVESHPHNELVHTHSLTRLVAKREG